MLSDRGNKVAHAYGVAYKSPQIVAEQSKGRLDLAKHNGDNVGRGCSLGATLTSSSRGKRHSATLSSDADYVPQEGQQPSTRARRDRWSPRQERS